MAEKFTEDEAVEAMSHFKLPTPIALEVLSQCKPDYYKSDVRRLTTALQHFNSRLESRFDLSTTGSKTKAEAVDIAVTLFPRFPKANLSSIVEQLDKNKDDTIDPNELKGFLFKVRGMLSVILKLFEKYNFNNDGFLSRSEITNYILEETFEDAFFIDGLFDDYDANNDQKFSREEFVTLFNDKFGFE